MWILEAVASAFFAGITSVLAKCGIKKTDSEVATSYRTAVVLLFSVIMVFVTGVKDSLFTVSAKTLTFLILSGISTGASWICYFKALSIGDINKVVPIDKSSTILSMILAFIFLREPFTFSSIIAVLLNMYLNYYKAEVNDPDYNEPISIILCTDKPSAKIEYVLGGLENRIFASKYVLYLPDKKALEEEVQTFIADWEEKDKK